MAGSNRANDRAFLPALRFASLTPLFDTVVAVTTREQTFKRRLLDQAATASGDSVLDLGSGTGTLAIMLKERVPAASVTGVDADPDVLSRARHKAAEARADVEFVEGFSTTLPFAADSFDAVVSTLFFHHLTSADKRLTLTEVVRVLKPGGRLVVGDWGKPGDPLMTALFLGVRAFDGFDVTADNARGALPELFEQAGLADVEIRGELRAPLGTLALYRGRKPARTGG
jgi:SAM-dependent methyltransferase